MKTTLVLPAHNEEEHIDEVVRKAKPYVSEVIVIDDGSGDRTTELAKKAGAVALRHPINLGKACALKTGCEAAVKRHADLIILMDSDGQHRPEDLPKFIQMLESKEADLVIGVREGGDKMPILRKCGNRSLEIMTRVLFGSSAKDIQSGFRAFRAEHYPLLKWNSKGYHADAEITVRALKRGLRCKEISIKTIYNDPHKGMTVLDGLGLLLQILIWKFTL